MRWRRRSPEQFTRRVRTILTATSTGGGSPTPIGAVYDWDPASTYVQEPPFFDDLARAAAVADIEGAACW